MLIKCVCPPPPAALCKPQPINTICLPLSWAQCRGHCSCTQINHPRTKRRQRCSSTRAFAVRENRGFPSTCTGRVLSEQATRIPSAGDFLSVLDGGPLHWPQAGIWDIHDFKAGRNYFQVGRVFHGNEEGRKGWQKICWVLNAKCWLDGMITELSLHTSVGHVISENICTLHMCTLCSALPGIPPANIFPYWLFVFLFDSKCSSSNNTVNG